MQKILLAEDDPNLGELLKDYLELKGKFDVTLSTDGEKAIEEFRKNEFDLCIFVGALNFAHSCPCADFNVVRVRADEQESVVLLHVRKRCDEFKDFVVTEDFVQSADQFLFQFEK